MKKSVISTLLAELEKLAQIEQEIFCLLSLS
ncbi:MAG: hypothetical protein RLZZ522_2200 [Verrucomicrobiota bacterium]